MISFSSLFAFINLQLYFVDFQNSLLKVALAVEISEFIAYYHFENLKISKLPCLSASAFFHRN